MISEYCLFCNDGFWQSVPDARNGNQKCSTTKTMTVEQMARLEDWCKHSVEPVGHVA